MDKSRAPPQRGGPALAEDFLIQDLDVTATSWQSHFLVNISQLYCTDSLRSIFGLRLPLLSLRGHLLGVGSVWYFLCFDLMWTIEDFVLAGFFGVTAYWYYATCGRRTSESTSGR